MLAQEGGGTKAAATSDALKVAVVDIQSLFQSYRKTIAAEREIDLARAEIQKNSQLATNEIQERRRMIEKRVFQFRNGELSEKEQAAVRRELPILSRELQMAEEKKLKERDLANQNLNRQMVRRMNGILEELVQLTAKRAEAEGFDLVIDSSGNNSTQLPPILFAKDATDITAMMRKELSKSVAKER